MRKKKNLSNSIKIISDNFGEQLEDMFCNWVK